MAMTEMGIRDSVIAVGTTSTRSLESAWDPQANGGEGAITARNRDATSLYLLPVSYTHLLHARERVQFLEGDVRDRPFG